jgi:hypothetical protein
MTRGGRRVRIAARLLAVIAGMTLPIAPSTGNGAAAASTPALPPRLPGINAQFLPPQSDVAGRNQAFDRIFNLGARIARIDSDWAAVESTPGVYDWSRLDAKVDELVSHGLSPRVILDYSNPLYSKNGMAAKLAGNGGVPPFGIGQPTYFPPDSPAPFATWAAALASRYRGRVVYLEVWNEQNLGWRFWEPHEDPAAYGALLKATYIAVKAVAPEDQVAFGGTFYPAIDIASAAADGIPIPNDPNARQIAAPHQGSLTFIANALNADPTLGNYFDALAYHPYHFPYMAPEVDIPIEGSTETSMVSVRALLDSYQLQSKPIWITEVGWPNNIQAYGASRDKSASYLVRTFATGWAHGIQQIDWYCYGDGGSDWTYNQEAAFGIVDTNGQPKPALTAWQTLNHLVGSLPFMDSQAAALTLPTDGHALRFGDGSLGVTVVWLAPETMYTDQGSLPPANQVATVPIPAGTTAIYDMLGNSLKPLGTTFTATPYPVYVVQDLTVVIPEIGWVPGLATTGVIAVLAVVLRGRRRRRRPATAGD